MCIIERIRKVLEVTPDYQLAKADIQVSTEDDLPAWGEIVDGTVCAPGSIAQGIQTGKWYTLDEDESWYDTDGNEV